MNQFDSTRLAGKNYQPDMQEGQDECMQGLQVTHEQATGYYEEGTVDRLAGKKKK